MFTVFFFFFERIDHNIYPNLNPKLPPIHFFHPLNILSDLGLDQIKACLVFFVSTDVTFVSHSPFRFV